MANALIPSEISVSDLDTALDAEPRILDTRLGKRLGIARPTNIRKLIEDNRPELELYGSLHAARAVIRAGKGAQRETTAYYLNEAQALLLCMFSRTDNAAAVRREVIEVFLAYRRDQAAPALPAPAMSPSCKGCAFGEFHEILRSETVPAKALLKGLSPEALAEVMTPPDQHEMALITDRRKERRELIEQVRREIASRLFGSAQKGNGR